MTTALVSAVNHVELPVEPGVSPRAARTVLRVYCRIAQADGGFRYGLRGSKIATLAEYSLATIRRVQRYLVAHGFLEKTQVGGGRASTRWRIVLDKLGIRHGSRPAMTRQPSRHDTAQEREPKRLGKMFSGWSRHDHPPMRSAHTDTSSPSPASVAASPAGQAAVAHALDWAAAAGRSAPLVSDVCRHGGRAGIMRSGLPWCPDCRMQARRHSA